MNLRTLGTIAATTAVIFAFPAVAAYAEEGTAEPVPSYPPQPYCAITANPASLQAGGSTTVSLIDEPNVDVDLGITYADSIPDSSIQIAGKQTAVKKSDAEGKVAFTVTLSEPGDYILDAMLTGQFCGLTVKVSPKDRAVEEVTDEEESEPQVAAAAVLANTGATTLPYLLAGAALVGGGAAAVAVSRRRRNNT